MTLEEKYREYKRLAHAMQSGVAFTMQHEDPHEKGTVGSTSHKHLRVGVNAAMSDHGALIALLIEKGIFTEEEYVDKLIEFMRREVKSYEQSLKLRFGKNITLA